MANSGEYAAVETQRRTGSSCDDLKVLENEVARMPGKIEEQNALLDVKQTDNNLYAGLSSAARRQIKIAFIDAAEEQYRLGDLLTRKAVAVHDEALPEPRAGRSKTIDLSQDGQERPQSIKDNTSSQDLNRNDLTAGAESVRAESPWIPRAIEQLRKLNLDINVKDHETFSWETITSNLGGRQWSPGYYFVDRSSVSSDSPLAGKAYWLLEYPYEPFAPILPGQHGAKLTAFFRTVSAEDHEGPEDGDFENLPVFVSLKGDGNYLYMGHYIQYRFSDKVGYDTLKHISVKVLQYWAEELSSPDRPEWLTVELMQHLWPKPAYAGPIPSDSTVTTPATTATVSSEVRIERHVRTALAQYALELKEWDRDARMKVSKLTQEALLRAFDYADSATTPGLRLNWEYLQCGHWDQKFYGKLVQSKHFINPEGRDRGRIGKKLKTSTKHGQDLSWSST